MSERHPTFHYDLAAVNFPPAYHRLIGLIEERVELWFRYRRHIDCGPMVGAYRLTVSEHAAVVDRLNANNSELAAEVRALVGAEQEAITP